MKATFKDASSMVDEMKESKVQNGIKLNAKEESNGEYYILTSNELEFYNSENKKFTIAKKI